MKVRTLWAGSDAALQHKIIGYAESELDANPQAVALALHFSDASGAQAGLFVVANWIERIGRLSNADASRVQASIDDLDLLLSLDMHSQDEMVTAGRFEALEELSTGDFRTLASGTCDKSMCLRFFAAGRREGQAPQRDVPRLVT